MPESDFHKTGYPFRTVCEVTRELYRLVEANKSKIGDDLYGQIFEKLKEQMRYQKKMDAKLKLYKADYEETMYKRTP